MIACDRQMRGISGIIGRHDILLHVDGDDSGYLFHNFEYRECTR